MLVKEVMGRRWLSLAPSLPVREAGRLMRDKGAEVAFVEGSDGQFLGLITWREVGAALVTTGSAQGGPVVADLMRSPDKLVVLDPAGDLYDAADLLISHQEFIAPVLEHGAPVGLARWSTLSAACRSRAARPNATAEVKASAIIRSLNEGLVLIDRNLFIREFNPAAETLTGRRAIDRIGKKAEQASSEDSPVYRVLQSGDALYSVESQMPDGRTFLANYVPIHENGAVAGVIQTFIDVSPLKRAERRLEQARDEIEKAFGLTLPNSKVEYKLKGTPEYVDEYDPETGVVRVLEVLPSGSYFHVINCLKVAADLHDKGIMNLIGVDKDTLVQAIIFHDLGKSQPKLAKGDIVDPRQAFELGRLHALRGAEIAQHFYGKSENVVRLIKYHHHAEDELPADFPAYLLPMYRLFRLVDGLSACLTRRKGSVHLKASGPSVLVEERNNHPLLSRRWSLNLLTGESEMLERLSVPMGEGLVAGG